MFFPEDETFHDLRKKSFEQWLDEMEAHEDICVRGGIKLAREYVAFLEDSNRKLKEENQLKNEYLKKMRQKYKG